MIVFVLLGLCVHVLGVCIRDSWVGEGVHVLGEFVRDSWVCGCVSMTWILVLVSVVLTLVLILVLVCVGSFISVYRRRCSR